MSHSVVIFYDQGLCIHLLLDSAGANDALIRHCKNEIPGNCDTTHGTEEYAPKPRKRTIGIKKDAQDVYFGRDQAILEERERTKTNNLKSSFAASDESHSTLTADK